MTKAGKPTEQLDFKIENWPKFLFAKNGRRVYHFCMKTNLVRFCALDGLRLEGLLFEPEKKTNRLVIHVHGAAGNFYGNLFTDTFAAGLTDNGYALLVFNNRGAEYEKETLNFAEMQYEVTGLLHEVFEDCTKDISPAIDFAKKSGYTEIILQGHSLGCNKVIWYAIEKGFKGKIILLAPCDLAREKDGVTLKNIETAKQLIKENKGKEKLADFWGQFNITAQSLVSCWSKGANADMFRYRDGVVVPALGNIKNDVLIEIGANDANYDQPERQDCIDYLKKSFKGAKISADIVKGANHQFEGKEKETLENILKFLLKNA